MDLPDQSELFIALVAAVGADVGMIGEEVGIELAEHADAAEDAVRTDGEASGSA